MSEPCGDESCDEFCEQDVDVPRETSPHASGSGAAHNPTVLTQDNTG